MLRVGLVPISAKPYHRGHHALVIKAADENDEVVLFVSISDRIRKNEFPILGSDMLRVWKEELEPIIPSNVRIEYGGSPVRKVYEEIGRACEEGSENIFTIYSDPQDTSANYSQAYRNQYMQPLCNRGQVKFAAEEDPKALTRGIGTPNVRGEDLRQALASEDFYTFASGLPEEVNAENIYSILSAKKLLEDFVAAIIK